MKENVGEDIGKWLIYKVLRNKLENMYRWKRKDPTGCSEIE